jgi:hypothetical protein
MKLPTRQSGQPFSTPGSSERNTWGVFFKRKVIQNSSISAYQDKIRFK